MKTRKTISMVLALVLMTITLLTTGAMAESALFAGGFGTEDSPWQIATAAQLAAVRENLSAHYELLNDIDLSDMEWVPIGAYVAADMSAGDVSAQLELAFTGSFKGNGYTISNLAIHRVVDEAAMATDMTGTGLFGGIAGSAYIHDVVLENVTIESNANCAAALVGMAMGRDVRIEKVCLIGENSISAIGSVAGLVGSAQDISIVGCSAEANVTMTGVGNGAGILGGGMEGGILVDCTASGTVSATVTMAYGDTVMGSVGVGGLAGCAFEATEITNCLSQDVTITVGDNAAMIGGLVGYSGIVNEGNYTSDATAMTEIRDCVVSNVTIHAAPGASRIGGVVGSGFCGPNYSGYYPASSAMHIVNCSVSGAIIGADEDAIVGSVLGYAFRNAAVVRCTGDMSGANHQIGAADVGQAVTIDELH